MYEKAAIMLARQKVNMEVTFSSIYFYSSCNVKYIMAWYMMCYKRFFSDSLSYEKMEGI